MRSVASIWLVPPLVVLAATLAGTATPGIAAEAARKSGAEKSDGAQQDRLAHADMRDTKGRDIGHVQITETPNGLLLKVRLSALPPGAHGFHIHETGRCEPASFESAGAHFNPSKDEHGFETAAGMHAGDLPNLNATSGAVEVSYFAPEITLDQGSKRLLDEDGAAFVVHSGPDDYESQPAGAAGDRIACGVIERGAEVGAEASASRPLAAR